MAQYIANFEGMKFNPDNNIDDKDLNEMEALIIDILLSPCTLLNNETSKTFFTLLGLVEKAEKMATNLADRLFSHCLITIGNV